MSITNNSNTTANDPFETTLPDEIVIVENKLKKRILKQGEPNTCPPKNANCTVHYTGRLTDGTKFDSSVDRNAPFNFKIGQGHVIKGWDEGVALMNKGEKSLLTCSSEYGYGAAGSPPTIPPNATLEFEVELIDWDDKTAVPGTENKVLKRLLVEGEKDDSGFPSEGAKVNITYSLKISKPENKELVNEEKVELVIGEQLDIPPGLEAAIKKMTKGEKSLFVVQPELGLKGLPKRPQYLEGVDENSVLEYTVQLDDYTNQSESWQLSRPQKLDRMLHLKAIGNEFFKATQYRRASEKYQFAVELVPPLDEEDVEDKDKLTQEQKLQLKQLEVQLHSNKAICDSKLGNWRDAIKECTSALEMDSNHVKTWFARGKAYAQIGQYEDAKHDLIEAQKLDGGKTKEITTELNRVTMKIKQQDERERKAFGGFFNKVSLVSDDELKAAKEAAEKAAKTSFSDDDMSDEENDSTNDKENANGNIENAPTNDPTKTDSTMQDESHPTKPAAAAEPSTVVEA